MPRNFHSSIIALIVACLVLPMAVVAQDVPDLQINSKRYIVLDASSGEIYVQKNAGERVAIASLTKVFTAVQALETASLDTVITTDESDLFDPATATLMAFGPGETYTLRDLLYGMMLPSGNDAAHAIARSLGHQDGDTPEQSVERFMGWVNQRNTDLGLTDTFLVNPTGWGVEGHYSTARDVATFMRYALSFPELVEAMGTRSYTTENGALTITNTNRLLSEWDLTEGGKTGYDWDSGYCLIEFASRDDATMISVTLDGIAPGDWYDDNKVLLTYAFDTRVARLESDAEFRGETAMFVDPAVAELARSASIGGSFAAANESAVIEPPVSEGAGVVPEVESNEERSPGTLSPTQPTVWIAIGTVLFLVVARGLWTFRRHNDHPRVDSGVPRA